jgi:hypothetical protein
VGIWLDLTVIFGNLDKQNNHNKPLFVLLLDRQHDHGITTLYIDGIPMTSCTISAAAHSMQGRRMKSFSQKSEHMLVIPCGLPAARLMAGRGCSITTL